MAIQNIVIESNVVYENDYIIFSRVAEDEWGHHGYTWEVMMYRPIIVDNIVIVHRYPYLNAKSTVLYERRGFGVISFNAACKMVAERVEDIKSLMNWCVEAVDAGIERMWE